MARSPTLLSATRAAVEEGIVPGGGVTLIRTEQVLRELEQTLSGEELLGARLLREALSAPITLIADNAGYKGQVVLESIRESILVLESIILASFCGGTRGDNESPSDDLFLRTFSL